MTDILKGFAYAVILFALINSITWAIDQRRQRKWWKERK